MGAAMKKLMWYKYFGVDYIMVRDSDGSQSEVYFCLHGKFYGWGTMNRSTWKWELHSFANPDTVA